MRSQFLFVLLCSPFVTLSAAEPALPASGREDPRFASVDRLMTSFLAEHKLPGVSVAIARQGRVVYARGFGYADLEARQPVRPESQFRIASISKPVTAAAVLHLVGRGKLRLDEAVFDVLSLSVPAGQGIAFDPRWKQITIDHLLYHTGGWDRGKSFDPMFVSPRIVEELQVPPPATPQAIIQYMLCRPLQFDPGAEYAYSNFGYCLLGRVIEKRGGTSYEKYVREQILTPLGIREMRLGHTLASQRAKDEVTYHTLEKEWTSKAILGPSIGQLVAKPYGAWSLESMDAHGGWIATASDLVRLAAAFEDPTRCPILAHREVDAMFSPPPGSPGRTEHGAVKDRYYCRGWQVVRLDERRFNFFHSGSLDGTSTLLVHRHDGLSWAILFNSRSGSRPPSSVIDPLMHKAIDEIKYWPDANDR